MNRTIILRALCLTFFFLSIVSSKEEVRELKGQSQSVYHREPYVGFVKITLNEQLISGVEFQILDTLNHEVFDSLYENHFPDNAVYRQQCRNDWKGVQFYPGELLKKQSIDSVDAVSGATWSYRIFKAAVMNALEKGKE